MKRYDAFIFSNELELLEIRLNILDYRVDYFVIIESSETFTGVKKPLYYKENQEKFKRWENKIIYYEIPEYPNDQYLYQQALNSPNTGNKEHWWMREFYQKEALIYALSGCEDSDIIFVSDLDEIWNPKMKLKIEEGRVYRPIQTAFPYYLNLRSDETYLNWTGTRIGFFKTLKEKGPNHFRTERETPSIPIPDGGWHFSWLDKKPDKWNDNHPDNHHRFYRTKYTKMEKTDEFLPDYIKNNKEKYKHLLLV